MKTLTYRKAQQLFKESSMSIHRETIGYSVRDPEGCIVVVLPTYLDAVAYCRRYR